MKTPICQLCDILKILGFMVMATSAVVTAWPAIETERDDLGAQVDSLFADAHGAPGAAVLVVQDGKVLHKKGYGLANLELGVANTPQTKFRIGSITRASPRSPSSNSTSVVR